jgi:hypothetical protein
VEPDRVHLIVTAAMMAAGPIVVCLLFITLCSRAANGRLARNGWAGIRTPSTMRSDRAWMAGHRAALRLTPLYLLGTVIICVAMLWAALYASTTGVVMVIGAGGFAVLLALLIYASVIAGKAAKSADDQPNDRYRQ